MAKRLAVKRIGNSPNIKGCTMTTRAEWIRFIKAGNKNRLDRMQRRLFQDIGETLECVLALADASNLRPQPAVLPGLYRSIRKALADLPLDRAEEVMAAVAKVKGPLNAVTVLLGTSKGELQASYEIFSRLAEMADRRLRVLRPEGVDWTIHLIAFGLIKLSALGATDTWSNLILYMHERKDASVLYRLLEGYSTGSVQLSVIPMDAWRSEYEVAKIQEEATTYVFPAPPHLAEWLQVEVMRRLREYRQRCLGLEDLVRRLCADAPAFNEIYQDMWLDMMTSPQWRLRDQGLDRVEIRIPELRQYGYEQVTLTPLEPFPKVLTTFAATLVSGAKRDLQICLEPSALLRVSASPGHKDTFEVWVDRALAFVAVRAMWTIVMGTLSRKSEAHGVRRTSAAAVVRARFRPLPEGHKASPEARARALDAFRAEPLPGFTFVKQHTRGTPSPESTDPIFAVTQFALK